MAFGALKDIKIWIILSCLLAACGTTQHPFLNQRAKDNRQQQPTKKLIESLYLIGDTGATDGKKNFVLTALQQQLEQESSASSIVFLGDQVYPKGLPKQNSSTRVAAEQILKEQLDILQNFNGKAYFIAGDRDWNKGQAKGLKVVKRQEDFVENYFPDKHKVKFYPGKGCADPKVVKINKDLIYIFLDTQWWLQDWSAEKKINHHCDIKSKHDLLKHIQEILTDHKNDEVVVFMHHPIYSNGNHGGRFSLKDHLLPFAASHHVPVPLPIIGSLVPLARNISGTKQDINNRHYQELMGGIEKMAMSLKMHVLFASAHDNGLQHFNKGKLQFVGSGSGGKTNHIGKGGMATFAYQERGFCKVSFYEEFEAWLEVYAVKGPNQAAELVYRTQIRAPRAGTVPEKIHYPPVHSKDTLLAANENFAAGGFKKAFLGEQYRNTWATPVKAPLIDLKKQFGGLTPIKKGGGMASNSLRMEKEDGKQYILRSINKDYRKLVPPGFGNLKLLNIMKDQNSASHPYGALVIPDLSKAANVFYTHPRLVYLKHQEGLDNYNSQFPEELYLLEERPSGNWGDAPQFGNSEKIIGFTDLLATLREKKNHFVDQHWVCKSRLFDLFLHDWDRHDDQWRWASFKEEGKTIYRPIPRDRDQAFYKFKGIVPSYVAFNLMKKFKTMKDDVRDIKHLSENAKHFDRYFMNELEWSDWKKEILALQQNLTDEAIASAMDALPPETRGKEDQELVRKLKSRRDKLLKIGKSLYDYLAVEVEIPGTDNDDIFEIQTDANGQTTVKVWVTRKEKANLLKYERTFYPHETKRVHLYGLRGEDQFTIKGTNNNRIKLRVIGGEEADKITNESAGKIVIVYDDIAGIQMEGGNLKDKTSNDVEVNDYNRKGFTYNTNFHSVNFGSTQDDGFWLGGSTSWTTQAWRKSPYQSKQKVSLIVAPNSRRAVIANYTGHFPQIFGNVGFAPTVNLTNPHYENYFGLGNNTANPDRELAYNWVRLESFTIDPLLRVDSKDGNTIFQFGPVFESHDIKNSEGRISEDATLGFTADNFDRRRFLGGTLKLNTGFVNAGAFPENGFKLGGAFSFLNTLGKEESVSNLDLNMQFYLTLIYAPKLVLANNIGYQKVFGDPQFYQYPEIGNTTNLRGFRNNRFRGESTFYQNVDLRLFLFKWNNTFVPMDVGILGGYDYGRVWLEEEESDKWHNSQTIGLWMNILGVAIIQPHYSFTEEGNVFSLRVGFNF